MLPRNSQKPIYGFRAKCPHAWRRIHLFRDEGDDFVFFRPRSFAADWTGAFWCDHQTYWSGGERDGKWSERRLRPQLAGSYFWRVFTLNDPREGEQRMWRIFWRPDFGYAEPLGQSSEREGTYFWPRPAKFNLWKTPTDGLKRHFEQEWNDSDSDVRLALPWCDLSHEERNTRAVIWKRGNQKGLELVTCTAMRLISLYSEGSTDAIYPIHIFLYWDGYGQDIQILIPLSVTMDSASENFLRQCWRRLRARIEERHYGIYNLPNGSRDDWILPWVNYHPLLSTHRASRHEIEISAPSQHERVEASLFLRDWLRSNAPDLLTDWFTNGV